APHAPQRRAPTDQRRSRDVRSPRRRRAPPRRSRREAAARPALLPVLMPALLLLQLGDSAFPAGGFAHSGGLEAAAQLGEVKGAEAVRAFCEQSLWQTGRGALP